MSRRLEVTPAIVLNRYDFRESDRIVVLLTRDLGLVRAFAKGLRKSHKRFGGIVDLLNCLEVELVRRKSDMMLLTGARLLEPFSPLSHSPMLLAAGCHLAEVASSLAAEDTPEPEIFALLAEALRLLGEGVDPAPVSRTLELRALAAAGFAPRLDACAVTGRALADDEAASFEPRHGGAVCLARAEPEAPRLSGGTRRKMIQVVAADAEALWTVPWSREELAEARAALQAALQYHLGRPLRARAFAENTARFGRERKSDS